MHGLLPVQNSTIEALPSCQALSTELSTNKRVTQNTHQVQFGTKEESPSCLQTLQHIQCASCTSSVMQYKKRVPCMQQALMKCRHIPGRPTETLYHAAQRTTQGTKLETARAKVSTYAPVSKGRTCRRQASLLRSELSGYNLFAFCQHTKN